MRRALPEGSTRSLPCEKRNTVMKRSGLKSDTGQYASFSNATNLHFLDAAKARNMPLRSATPRPRAGELVMTPISTLRRLNRSLLAVSVVVAAVTGSAGTAQTQSLSYTLRIPPSSQSMEAVERHGRSVARTGATVPNPGTAKIGPQTEIERRAQERSDRAIRTICTGCL
jgi:hypothetical protein